MGGYGEVVPSSGLGRLVGAVCATFGVLVIALPIPIIGNQFGKNFLREQRMTKLMERLGPDTVFNTGLAAAKFNRKTNKQDENVEKQMESKEAARDIFIINS